MGDILVDKTTKGYKEIADAALLEKLDSDVSPALLKLSEFIDSAQSSTRLPLRLNISLADEPEKNIELTIHNINELRDILHFAIDS